MVKSIKPIQYHCNAKILKNYESALVMVEVNVRIRIELELQLRFVGRISFGDFISMF